MLLRCGGLRTASCGSFGGAVAACCCFCGPELCRFDRGGFSISTADSGDGLPDTPRVRSAHWLAGVALGDVYEEDGWLFRLLRGANAAAACWSLACDTAPQTSYKWHRMLACRSIPSYPSSPPRRRRSASASPLRSPVWVGESAGTSSTLLGRAPRPPTRLWVGRPPHRTRGGGLHR